MTDRPPLWTHDGEGWGLVPASGFPLEADLHDLVEGAPHLLPLAGDPELVVVGREVQLGTGYADLIAVEPSGRLVVIEVKLAKNPEARRAIIAQALGYAAFLYGLDPEILEREILRNHLHQRGFASLREAIGAAQGSAGVGDFESTLADNLAAGRIRVVLVLDEAPEELQRIAAYLTAITGELILDLITVASYEVNGAKVLVPQRVGSEPVQQRSTGSGMKTSTGSLGPPEDFLVGIDALPESHQVGLRRLYEWAKNLETEFGINLQAYTGVSARTLLPRLRDGNAGLVAIYRTDKAPSLGFFRSVFQRCVPNAIGRVEELLGRPIGQGTYTSDISDELLAAVYAAYKEHAGATRSS